MSTHKGKLSLSSLASEGREESQCHPQIGGHKTEILHNQRNVTSIDEEEEVRAPIPGGHHKYLEEEDNWCVTETILAKKKRSEPIRRETRETKRSN